jgi:hypothetical protein
MRCISPHFSRATPQGFEPRYADPESGLTPQVQNASSIYDVGQPEMLQTATALDEQGGSVRGDVFQKRF